MVKNYIIYLTVMESLWSRSDAQLLGKLLQQVVDVAAAAAASWFVADGVLTPH